MGRRFNIGCMESKRRPIRPSSLYLGMHNLRMGDGETKFVDRIRNPVTSQCEIGATFSGAQYPICAYMGAVLGYLLRASVSIYVYWGPRFYGFLGNLAGLRWD